MKYKSMFYIPLIFQFIITLDSFSQMITFYPQADTIKIVGGCTPPQFICKSPNYSYWPIRIIVEPGWNTRMEYDDSSGNTIYISDCYFAVEDNLFEYEVWFLPQEIVNLDTQIVPFDSSITIAPTKFNLKLLVKDQGLTIDSLMHAFIGIMEPLKIEGNENSNIPEIELLSNFPNPFNNSTTINFKVLNSGIIDLSVYDLRGQLVTKIKKEYYTSGEYSIVWNVENESSGIYFILLKNDQDTIIRKCIMIK